MLNNLSSENLRRALPKLFLAVMLLLLSAIAASAYTLVFRDGRRMEIPDEFMVTRTTLTYEVSPGFSKTMQIILIDVAATERANHESPGSFFKHTEETTTAADPIAPAVRTLTNQDLVAVRQRRIESEQAYETRRKELGLPTVSETRRRQAEDAAVLHEEIRDTNLAKAREESYWRGRARDLRAEIATVDTQINYLRGRLSEFRENPLDGLVITEVYPYWPPINRRSQRWPNYRVPPFGFPPVARPNPGLGYPYPYPYPSYPYPSGSADDYRNSERADLTGRLDDLLVKRSGLAAQWRLLEDEAREARVPQVWLEP